MPTPIQLPDKPSEKYYAADHEHACVYSGGPYNSIQEALDSAPGDLGIESKPCVLYIGQADYFQPSINAWSVLEQLESDAHEHCGEVSECWTPSSESDEALEELENQLNAALEQWMKKHNCTPAIAAVTNVKRYEVKQAP